MLLCTHHERSGALHPLTHRLTRLPCFGPCNERVRGIFPQIEQLRATHIKI